jgi:chemosensory pili system protein ChpA (sensor histidine kinase/response regulator)
MSEMSEFRAMIVEDDKDQAIIFARAMERAGFQTAISRAGDVALEKLNSWVPDVIILDLYIPRIMGMEVLRHIRNDPRLAKTRVIAVTGSKQKAEEIRGKVDLVLVKPIGYDRLKELARQLMALVLKRRQR